MRRLLALVSVVVVLASCSPAEDSAGTTTPPSSTTTSTTIEPTTTTTQLPAFSMSSPTYGDGGPAEHTCDGPDVSPELNLRGLPEGTRAIAVIVEDPDAPLGVWYHWAEFDIPADKGSFDIASDAGEIGVPGVNSWNLEGYMGPCPTEGEEHRSTYRVYALDSMLGLPQGVGAEEILTALEANAIDSVELTATYSR